jgi:hypothetical protein
MKHVIVIETIDGRFPERRGRFEQDVVDAVEREVRSRLGICFVSHRFFVDSALAAVHEIYGVPNCQHPEGV